MIRLRAQRPMKMIAPLPTLCGLSRNRFDGGGIVGWGGALRSSLPPGAWSSDLALVTVVQSRKYLPRGSRMRVGVLLSVAGAMNAFRPYRALRNRVPGRPPTIGIEG